MGGCFEGVIIGEGQEKGNLPMQSRPMDRIALNAYSIWYRRPSGEKIVMYRSYPPLDILKSKWERIKDFWVRGGSLSCPRFIIRNRSRQH